MSKYLIFFLLISNPAYAYLDPGSGSLLLYFIMGLFATVIFYFKWIIYKIREFFIGSSSKKKIKNSDKIDIFFYSEGGQYWNVFKPIIEELEKKEIESVYYTNKENDPAINSNYKYLKVECIGDDISSFVILNNIKAKLFITTTPQLNVMQLKKSKYVDEYIHIVHSPTDCLYYRYFAFDFFDTIMCSGNHQIESIRELEHIRKTKKKELLQTGLTYFDILKESKEKFQRNKKKQDKKIILVAPTWRKDNLLEKYGINLLKKLVSLNYDVILRPHPQIYISNSEKFKKFEFDVNKFDEIKIDKDSSAEESMMKADVMISDLSGIIFDFYFVYEKPVISMNRNISILGQEAELVSKKPWETENLEKVATIFNSNNLDDIEKYLSRAFEKTTIKNLEKFREESLFNYGSAGEVAANQIIQRI